MQSQTALLDRPVANHHFGVVPMDGLTYGALSARINLMHDLFAAFLRLHPAAPSAAVLARAERHLARSTADFRAAFGRLPASAVLDEDMISAIWRFIDETPRLCAFGKKLIWTGVISPQGPDKQWITMMTRGPSKNGWDCDDIC